MSHDAMAVDGALRMGAALGRECRLECGDDLPLLWHWAYFPPLVATGGLGEDGHPPREDEYVERFPRRVAGGGGVVRYRPFIIGTPAERRSRLEKRREVTGRSGPMVVATWWHQYYQEGQLVLEERQDLIYRPGTTENMIEALGRPGPNREGASCQAAGRALHFDPVLLFRYSGATWNAHRVHYDYRYATEVEGYPGLLVQAPLLATLLAEEAKTQIGTLARVEYRSSAPVFDSDGLNVVVAASQPGAVTVEAHKQGGRIAATLTAQSIA